MNLSLSQRQQDILVSTFMTGKQLFVFCLYIYKYNFVLQSHNPVRMLLPTCSRGNRREIQNLSGVLFGNERLVRVFSKQQHIVDRQSAGNTDLVIFLLIS